MRLQLGLQLVCVVAALGQPPPQPPSCSSEEYRRMDFLIGDWEVEGGGQASYRPAVRGCLIIEDRISATGVQSKGILFYDPNQTAWQVLSISRDGILEVRTKSDGTFEGGVKFEKRAEAWTLTVGEQHFSHRKAATFPEQISSKAPACNKPEDREFDFWAGQWEVFSPRGDRIGVSHVYPAAGGCVLVENWTGGGGALNPGLSLNFRDKGTWRQVWVAPGGSILRLTGHWDGAALRYTYPDRTKLTFTKHLDGTVRQHWEQSNDQGKTWGTAFDGTYRRTTIPPPATLAEELTAASAATKNLFSDITSEQSKFRTAEAKWNLHEILQHLVAAEKLAQSQVKDLSSRKTPNADGFNPGPVDRLLLPMIANRNQRFASPEVLQPGKSSQQTLPQLLQEFEQLRQSTIDLVKSGANLRGARAPHPLGQANLDAYQWLQAVAMHNRRHLDQADEVKRDPRFPSTSPVSLRMFSGFWSGEGTFQGKPVKAEATWAPALDGKFNELSVKIRTSESQSFSGRALYGANLQASWSDSTGNAYGVQGKWDGTKLVSTWGDRGRSTYALTDKGELEIIDEIKGATAGEFKEFGHYKLSPATVRPAIIWDTRNFSGPTWRQAFESGSMIAGVYNIASGAIEDPKRRDTDQILFIESGNGYLEVGSQQFPVQPGSMILVRKGTPHRFHSIERPLKVIALIPKEH
jgi:quercetin dioxygenase-like cupin family protein